MKLSTVTLTASLLGGASAMENGKGRTPPMGWRSWNLFGSSVSQELLQTQMDGIVSRSRLVDGVPTSLLDLGYSDVGLDDAWQLCGKYGHENYTYHDKSGKPVVNEELFPDFNALTSYAHSLGLTAGWYANNCICEDHCDSDACYQEDVNALVRFGFDSVKLDGCGAQEDLDKWASLIEESGSSILIENCHWGYTIPTQEGWCPFNMYRTSGDIRSNFDYVLSNLMSTVRFSEQQLSYPGCWAYPDMLEVGCKDGPNAEDFGLSLVEARTHFGAWCIVSSPLVLSHDMTDAAVADEIWPIISNKEAIAINQAWAGDAGSLFKSAEKMVSLNVDKINTNPRFPGITLPIFDEAGSWQQWSKKLSSTTAAVLLMNNDVYTQMVRLNFDEIPAFSSLSGKASYSLRDVWAHADLGEFAEGSFSAEVAPHDSVFLVVSRV